MKGQQPQINCLIPSHTCFKPIRLGISCGYKNTSYFPRHKKKHISQKAANTRKILVSLHKCAHWSITFWETRRSSSYFFWFMRSLSVLFVQLGGRFPSDDVRKTRQSNSPCLQYRGFSISNYCDCY